MNRSLKILVAILGIVFVISLFGPREPVDWEIYFSDAEIGQDVDAYLAMREAETGDIMEGAQKEVIWAGAPGRVTPVSIVYVHGFSATKQEIRPVPDNVARDLGANLYYTRLTGHGRGGAALARATVNDWLNDVAEAVSIGRRIGEKVVIIATSQGGTMTGLSAIDPVLMRNVAGIVFVSPNFGLASPMSGLLTMPFARTIVPLMAGAERSWQPFNEQHEKWWTTSYPTVALMPVAAAVRASASLPLSEVRIPAFFIYADSDTVVRADAIRRVADMWGGPVEQWAVELGPGDDPAAHVIAGDILSPSMTAPVSERILAWINELDQ